MRNLHRMKAAAALVLVAAALTALAGSGLLNRPDQTLSDLWYQGRIVTDGEIVLVGIDQRALEEIGPFNQWGRDVLALTIETLNASEESRPAVIAVDVLFAGETVPELDEWLVEAAGAYGNVVTACAAEFNTALVEDESGELRLDEYGVTAFDWPFDALREVTTPGHINAMMDADGILRRHMLELELPDGTVVPSMALAAARMYRDYWGEEPPALPPTDSHNFWYLPFSGLPGDYDEGISVADILAGEVDADYFAGKVVLIGPYTTGLQDSFLTPIDHARAMYGVEVLANAIQALLRGRYQQAVSGGVQLAVLFGLLLLAAFGFWKRPVPLATGLWALLCGGSLAASKALYAGGWIVHILWIPVGVTLLYVGTLAANYIQAARERRMVTRTFERYVDPSVIHELLKQGSDSLGLGGKLVDIAVLFVDIRGFTTMSEVLTPEQVVEILNQYLELTTQSVMRNHGTLDKFVGDCTMAIWNAPLPQEDYIMNACKAAMDMVKGSQPLAEKLRAEFGRDVHFGIGVHTGPAVVGNIGATMRMDYTAIGDTVNTAARLEANAPAGTIYISRAVADALAGRIRATPLETPIKLKGKADGFEILTLDEIL